MLLRRLGFISSATAMVGWGRISRRRGFEVAAEEEVDEVVAEVLMVGWFCEDMGKARA